MNTAHFENTMKDKDPIARAAESAAKTHPPRVKAVTQDLAELKRLYPIEELAEFAFLTGEGKPYDLSQFKPFETIAFGYPPRPQVTAESLARFMVMEGVTDDDPKRLSKFIASIEAKTNKPK